MAMEFTTMAAFFWSFVGCLAFFRSLLPPEFYEFLDDYKRSLLERWSFQHQVQVHEDSGAGPNELYSSVHLHLSTLKATAEAVMAECSKNATKITFALAPNQRLFDEFRGRRMRWKHEVVWRQDGLQARENKSYKLTVAKADMPIVSEYLDFVLKRGKELEKQDREKRLYTNLPDYWESVNFVPPATFDTVAMDPGAKQLLVDDLNKFMNGKGFYSGVGRAWKRGYLLYGPPGTGKSSLIGALANFTGYDVYDLELTKVSSNMELRQLLINISNKAIIVVEDIDCSIDLTNREDKKKNRKKKKMARESNDHQQQKDDGDGVTLSGLLNFTDGLWSSCGSERIFVFTTNYVKKLDPALLRPGRMDMHISMSYCTYPIFKVLAFNYLKIQHHELFPEIEGLLLPELHITPANVVEVLLRYSPDVNLALRKLMEALKGIRDKPHSNGEDVPNDFDHKPCSSSSSSSSDSEEEADTSENKEIDSGSTTTTE